jgi:hypothetical protein
VGEEKGAQPTGCPILREAEKERIKCRIKEAGKRADHDQDLKTDDKIQHDRTIQERFAFAHTLLASSLSGLVWSPSQYLERASGLNPEPTAATIAL